MKRLLTIACFILPVFLFAQPYRQLNASEIQLAIKKLNTLGSVLYIAAHPDDENTRLLSYLANERLMRTAYLSLTRGDGGQNLIGTEQSELLGLIRTQELLAARRLDGAEQYFTRANDFGFSKNPEETFAMWGKDAILADIVWVIRSFRPDVIITRFPATGEGGHGHHTASAILAEEAFYAAADPARFPEQLSHVQPWQAKRLYWNSFGRWRDPAADVSGMIAIETGLFNPLLGKSYGEMAAESRSMHKSQGFGSAGNRGSIIEYFKYIQGDSAVSDLFEGINTQWTRVIGSQKIGSLLQKTYQEFQPDRPDLSLPFLLKVHDLLVGRTDYWSIQKLRDLEEVILQASGFFIEAVTDDYAIAPGIDFHLRINLIQRSGMPIKYRVSFYGGEPYDTTITGWSTEPVLEPNEYVSINDTVSIFKGINYSNQYWLRDAHTQGIYTVNEMAMIGKPVSDPPVYVSCWVLINGQEIHVKRPIIYKWVDPVDGELYRPLEIVPAVTVNIRESAYIFTGKEPVEVKLLLKASIPKASGAAKLSLPEGWVAQPAYQPFDMDKKGDEITVSFLVYPPDVISSDSAFVMKAVVDIQNTQLSSSLSRIQYPHIPTQALLYEAQSRLVPVDLKIEGKKIGYIMGAGDEIPASLSRVGYEVTLLDDNMLAHDSLTGYDAIIIGIRAYNTNDRLPFYKERLMTYVAQGGTVIVQYNTSNFLGTVKHEIGPYPFKISRSRVTVEEAYVTFEVPGHPVLNTPNKISQKDFENWVQERGLYFATEWDENYVPVFSMNDPNEQPHMGSLIIAKYGKGYFAYTGISFFRQLPAGVPGAYRLFANLIALGKN
ncbi:MAG: PIG-L family deacetylase [Bacteroidota bacterium]|nr:PIG-L family deacetylase [Bacteroidota bacterium]